MQLKHIPKITMFLLLTVILITVKATSIFSPRSTKRSGKFRKSPSPSPTTEGGTDRFRQLIDEALKNQGIVKPTPLDTSLSPPSSLEESPVSTFFPPQTPILSYTERLSVDPEQLQTFLSTKVVDLTFEHRTEFLQMMELEENSLFSPRKNRSATLVSATEAGHQECPPDLDVNDPGELDLTTTGWLVKSVLSYIPYSDRIVTIRGINDDHQQKYNANKIPDNASLAQIHDYLIFISLNVDKKINRKLKSGFLTEELSEIGLGKDVIFFVINPLEKLLVRLEQIQGCNSTLISTGTLRQLQTKLKDMIRDEKFEIWPELGKQVKMLTRHTAELIALAYETEEKIGDKCC
jgi:hypothetical protein